MRNRRQRTRAARSHTSLLALPLAWLAAMGGEIDSHSKYDSPEEPYGARMSKRDVDRIADAKAAAARRKKAREEAESESVTDSTQGGYL